MKKRFLAPIMTTISVVTMGCLIFSGIEAGKVKAAPDDGTYDVWVQGIRVTDANRDNVLGDEGEATVSYNPGTKTLTLKNATIKGTEYTGVEDFYATAGIRFDQEMTINLVGENTINASNVDYSDCIKPDETSGVSFGIRGTDDTYLTITGDGILQVNMTPGQYNLESNIGIQSHYISIQSGNIMIHSAETKNENIVEGTGICGFTTVSGGITVAEGYTTGLYGTLKQSGGSLTAKSTKQPATGESTHYLAGVYSFNAIEVSGGVLETSGYTYGIYCWDNVNNSGGYIYASATGEKIDEENPCGIYALKNIHFLSGPGQTSARGETAVRTVWGTINKADDLAVIDPTNGMISSDGKIIVEEDGTTVAKTVTVCAPFYPIWVRGYAVNDYNKDDILGDGTGSAVYDPETNTLILNDPAVFNGMHPSGAQIVSQGIDLTIQGSADLCVEEPYAILVLAGLDEEENLVGGSLTLDNVSIEAYGQETAIKAEGAIAVTGKLAATGGGNYGIYSQYGDITIDGTVTASAPKGALLTTKGAVKVNGGSVTVSDGGIGGFGGIDLIAGSVDVTNTDNYALSAYGCITVGNEIDGVTLSSSKQVMISNSGNIQLGDKLLIEEPEGASLSADEKLILDSDGNAAKHAVIVPKKTENDDNDDNESTGTVLPDSPEGTSNGNSGEISKDIPGETPNDTPGETPNDNPGETPDDTQNDTPGETPDDTQNDTPGDAPEDNPADTPKDEPEDTPKDTPKDEPADTPKDTPKDTPADTPEDTPKDAPADAPEDTPSGSGKILGSVTGAPKTGHPGSGNMYVMAGLLLGSIGVIVLCGKKRKKEA